MNLNQIAMTIVYHRLHDILPNAIIPNAIIPDNLITCSVVIASYQVPRAAEAWPLNMLKHTGNNDC